MYVLPSRVVHLDTPVTTSAARTVSSVRILAHRGSPGAVAGDGPGAAENTVAAVAASLREGADGVEVDLRLSADGVLVVCHDPDLGRLTGRPLPVAATGWEELRAAADASGVALARVEWMLAAMAGRPVVLELKAPPPGPGSVRRTAEAVVERLAVLAAAGLPLEVTLSSFAPSVVAAVRAVAPGPRPFSTALLGRPTMRAGALLRQGLAGGHDEIHPHVAALLAEPGCAAAAHRCGVGVVAWTVNSSRAVRRLAALDIDAVITDVPSHARSALTARSGTDRSAAAGRRTRRAGYGSASRLPDPNERTAYAEAPSANAPPPVSTEASGSVAASTRQPISPAAAIGSG